MVLSQETQLYIVNTVITAVQNYYQLKARLEKEGRSISEIGESQLLRSMRRMGAISSKGND